MTDSVLTEEEVTELGRPSTPWDSITRREVIASHRLLQQQVNELEEQVANWKEAFGALDV